MSFYGMDPDAVQSVGQGVYGLEPEASSAVHGVLGSYTSAAGVVHHPLMASAMHTFHDTHKKGHLALPDAVADAGADTASAGVAVADGQNEDTRVQKGSYANTQALSRDMNQHIVA
ncbi:MAG: hypothetical protein ACRDP4_09600 [Nocardioidaceae bacterium]